MIEAYPLTWPLGYKRTPAGKRIESKFKQNMEAAQQFLRQEIKRLEAKELIVSSNIPVRKDGMFYTDYMNRKLDDPGVSIFFTYNDQQISMCCDQYLRVWENIYALGKGIEALRGMDRWGVSDFINRAFTGFKALPEQTTGEAWYTVLEVAATATQDQIKEAYRKKALRYHPDKNNGDANRWNVLQQAYKLAQQTFSQQ